MDASPTRGVPSHSPLRGTRRAGSPTMPNPLRTFGQLVDNEFPGAHARLVQPFHNIKPQVEPQVLKALRREGEQRKGTRSWDATGDKKRAARSRPDVVGNTVLSQPQQRSTQRRSGAKLQPVHTTPSGEKKPRRGRGRPQYTVADEAAPNLDRVDYMFRDIDTLERLLLVPPRTPPKGKARAAHAVWVSHVARVAEHAAHAAAALADDTSSSLHDQNSSSAPGRQPAFTAPALPGLGRVAPQNGRAAPADVPPCKLDTAVVLLVGNRIHDLRPLVSVFDQLLVGGHLAITTLDLSQNDVAHVPDELLELRNLRILNLAANKIASPGDVWKLAALPQLFNLTTNGNPVENLRDYKMKIIARFPSLRILNSTPISRVDREKLGVLKGCMLPPLSFQRDADPFATQLNASPTAKAAKAVRSPGKVEEVDDPSA